ncbi:conjugal transfer protein TraH, partial [Salmonella enterica]|nr:conjugal transfer protein TraH [Salmonella enterica]
RHDNSFVERVTKIIQNISEKLRTDERLTDQEKGFIESTSVPILRYLMDPQMLNISSFYPNLADYIAYDILLQYLHELLKQARLQLNSKNYSEDALEKMRDNLNQASAQLQSLQSEVNVKANILMELEQRMSYLRQQVSTRLMGQYEQNLNFSAMPTLTKEGP